MSFLTALTILVVSLVTLAWGSNRFVSGASALASNLGLPPLFIGVVLIGFATSLPEMMVSMMAALNGNALMAVGNALGSNIANVGLVMACAAIICPLNVLSSVLQRLYPMLLLVYVVILVLLLDGRLSFNDGLLLSVLFLMVAVWMTLQSLKPQYKKDPMVKETLAEVETGWSTPKAVTWWLIGLLVVLVSANYIVQAASAIASILGVSDVVIGLTIVAIGTSLPELAAAVTAALKNEPDLIVGNVIGSNLFNALPVLMMPALLSPTDIPAQLIRRDFSIMLAFTIAIVLFGRKNSHGLQLSRWAGGTLLLSYLAYIFILGTDAL